MELAETAAALRGATRRSLVIMDELGRGTSTFDGTAIASATVKHLVERSQCLTLFATHYHSLLDEWRGVSPHVRLGHMQCIVNDDNDDEQKDESCSTGISNDSNITFLYTLGPGSCPKVRSEINPILFCTISDFIRSLVRNIMILTQHFRLLAIIFR